MTERALIDSSTSAHDLVSTAPRTFFGAPSVRDLAALDTQVAFLGVPFDGGTPQPGNRTGQTAGPAAARLASWEQFDYGSTPDVGAQGWYDIETDREHLVGVTMADVGDVAIQGSDDRSDGMPMIAWATQSVTTSASVTLRLAFPGLQARRSSAVT